MILLYNLSVKSHLKKYYFKTFFLFVINDNNILFYKSKTMHRGKARFLLNLICSIFTQLIEQNLVYIQDKLSTYSLSDRTRHVT